jgi:hypothetical protein
MDEALKGGWYVQLAVAFRLNPFPLGSGGRL